MCLGVEIDLKNYNGKNGVELFVWASVATSCAALHVYNYRPFLLLSAAADASLLSLLLCPASLTCLFLLGASVSSFSPPSSPSKSSFLTPGVINRAREEKGERGGANKLIHRKKLPSSTFFVFFSCQKALIFSSLKKSPPENADPCDWRARQPEQRGVHEMFKKRIVRGPAWGGEWRGGCRVILERVKAIGVCCQWRRNRGCGQNRPTPHPSSDSECVIACKGEKHWCLSLSFSLSLSHLHTHTHFDPSIQRTHSLTLHLPLTLTHFSFLIAPSNFWALCSSHQLAAPIRAASAAWAARTGRPRRSSARCKKVGKRRAETRSNFRGIVKQRRGSGGGGVSRGTAEGAWSTVTGEGWRRYSVRTCVCVQQRLLNF